jgi:hypothetical protein
MKLIDQDLNRVGAQVRVQVNDHIYEANKTRFKTSMGANLV